MGVVRREELQSRLSKPLNDSQSLVITPLLDAEDAFDLDSIDVRLGQTFLLPKSLQQPYFCPDKTSQDTLYVEVFVPFGHYLIIPAHQTVLGATLEFIKLPRDLCAEILTKSSIARRFVVIETAPWVHPEYRGCLTLEIANVSNTPILLYPGRKIGQLIFMHLDPDMTVNSSSAASASREKLNSTYFGPVYPEGPKFKDPEDDLRNIGILETWTIAERSPGIPDTADSQDPASQTVRLNKLREIQEHIDKSVVNGPVPVVPKYLLRAILDGIAVTDPEHQTDEQPTALVTAVLEEPNVVFGSGVITGGTCSKPGNIRINVGTFVRLGPSAYQAVHSHSVLGILQVAWALWEIVSKQTMDLTIQQVVVFRAMWELGRGQRPLTQDEILSRCNEDYKSQDLGVLTVPDLEKILNDLETLKCVRAEPTRSQSWSVVDQIIYQYQ